MAQKKFVLMNDYISTNCRDSMKTQQDDGLYVQKIQDKRLKLQKQKFYSTSMKIYWKIIHWHINPVIFILLFSSGAFSQVTAANAPDSILSDLLGKLQAHEEIDRDIAVKYLHLDSIFFQENAGIHSDSSLTFGSHIFWFVNYAAVVNCEHTWLIEYETGSRVFKNWLHIKTVCDFDPSGDHTGQTHFKIKGSILYVYDNYYRIRNLDLVLDKKKSTYSAYRLPDLSIIFKKNPLQ